MVKRDASTVVPRLRFPDFRAAIEWAVDNLAGVANFINDKIAISELHTRDYISTENLLPDYGETVVATKLPEAASVTRYKRDDVLISNIRPYLKKVWRADRDGGASNDVIVVRAKPSLSKAFLSLILRNDAFIAYVMESAKGVKMPRGDVDAMRMYPVAYPEPGEQQKIADCLTSLDEVIATQGRKVAALKAHKRGLMQQFFPREGETRPRLRLPEFRGALDWEERKLGEFITERSERASTNIPLYSLTIEAGVTPKTERYERSFLVSDEADAYKVAKSDDFAFNPMNLRFGAIGRHSGSQPVALSKYYNIFCCDESVDSRFCDIYFRSDIMVALYDRIATGSLIEKRRVHFNRFLKLHIAFPSLPEQQRIADCLSSLDTRIAAESNQLAALKTHKQGLMQQLFPVPEATSV